MRAVVIGEYRLFRGPDGHVYAESVFGYEFWQRYLDVFEEVVVVARVAEVGDTSSMTRVNGPRVSVHAMPYYTGFADFLRTLPRLRRAASDVADLGGALILRVPGAVPSAVFGKISRSRPFALEVVGDPMDVFAPGVVEPPLRRVVRWAAVRRLRRQARRATAVAYVSKYSLADRYPAGPGVPTFAYSSASLPEEAFAKAPRTYSRPLEHIIAIGSMEQMYKGFDVLIRAVSALHHQVPGLRVTIVGGGRHAEELVSLTEDLGVNDLVSFTGVVREAAQVRELLDDAELLVSASRTEGLPRTVLEAHARGLACVGTDVGATAELLERPELCPADDVTALAELIAALVAAPGRATAVARRGWERSRNYRFDALQQERNRMFLHLRDESHA